jgi:single-strand DNA-binding protein
VLNHVTLIGRLVADPETRATPSGKSVCSIRIAVDRKGREKETDFFGCTAFGQTGDALATYAQKGRLVAVVGKIQLDNYTDKDGVKRQSVKVLVDQWTLLDSRKEQGDQAPSPPNPRPAGAIQVNDIDDPFADD